MASNSHNIAIWSGCSSAFHFKRIIVHRPNTYERICFPPLQLPQRTRQRITTNFYLQLIRIVSIVQFKGSRLTGRTAQYTCVAQLCRASFHHHDGPISFRSFASLPKRRTTRKEREKEQTKLCKNRFATTKFIKNVFIQKLHDFRIDGHENDKIIDGQQQHTIAMDGKHACSTINHNGIEKQNQNSSISCGKSRGHGGRWWAHDDKLKQKKKLRNNFAIQFLCVWVINYGR